MLHGGSYWDKITTDRILWPFTLSVEGVKEILASSKFPTLITILLFFGISLDIGVTNYIFITQTERFIENEMSYVALNVGTEKWYIFSLFHGFASSFYLLLVYYFNPNKNRKYTITILSYMMRFIILYATLFLLITPVGGWLFF